MIANHALRSAISDEMHVRRLPRFSAPCRMMQIVTVVGEKAGDAARRHVETLAQTGRVTVPIASKYGVLALGDVTLVWEGHTEFASYTLIRSGAFDEPFDPARFEPQLTAILADMPGDVVRATQIAIMARGTPDLTPAQHEAWFSAEGTVVCDVDDGAARIVSDFRLHPDGYGRLIVLDRDLAGDEPAQLVQRLQELGNYRNMALLGLPLAQHLTPAVTDLESRLADLTRAVSERRSEDDRLLDELTYLSAELARMVAETRYRMSATRAYAQLSSDRLASLRIGRVRGNQTLADFTERRLTPAVRTCESFSTRLENLSQRAAWTSELLRTRIDIALAKQNRDLLTSMDRRTHLQLRLQQTVEGLSVVAISYYLIALISYVLHAVPGLHHEWAMAIAVPLVVAGVTLALWSLRRRLHD
ncbi:DUF3422 family protein [Sphingomonas radiodurans]|uniref:DUF3422 family protein n=1 Tax=Sphingomonas radiodurans TaxID=2890321 RepID=UPI001E5A7199|nr:DUF3422 domain-containing protein [Sphingomonas radiodurans]WBH15578.1 DUF3422 domain-containing protein [Sphingomonas radiodurans]